MGAILALCASASWGAGDFLGGLTSRRRGAIGVMAVSQPIAPRRRLVSPPRKSPAPQDALAQRARIAPIGRA